MTRIFQTFLNLSHNLIGLLYPELCCGCGASLLRGEKIICTSCLVKMPKSQYHTYIDNPVEKIFWGRIKIERATSFFLFVKGSPYQNMLHQIKYKGRQDLGIYLGELFGRDLIEEETFRNFDMIIPVPLHPDKERKRGYNQSRVIAQGLSNIMNIPVVDDVLYRKTFTQTQTKKSRYERWENVEDVFEIRSEDKISGKHILLVDDVLTTGATLEGCAQTILKINDIKISIVTLAYANK